MEGELAQKSTQLQDDENAEQEQNANEDFPANAQIVNGMISFGTAEDHARQSQQLEEMRKRLAEREAMMQKFRNKTKARRKNSPGDQYFDEVIKAEKSITARLESAEEGVTTPEFFEELKAEHGKLVQDLSTKGRALNKYLLEKVRTRIDNLGIAIDDRQKEIAPKKKFRFSRRKKQGKKKKEKEEVVMKAVDLSKYQTGKEIQIKDQNVAVIYKPPGSINGSDLVISNLRNCTVSICDNVGALRINNVSHCKIYVGPIATSMILHEIEHSTVMIATRQCRIHSATETDFYLQVNSDPIIEHSHSVRFGPYSFAYPELSSQFESSGLNLDVNLWNNVKDFNWHRQQHSPNWVLIPEGERITSITPVVEDDDEF